MGEWFEILKSIGSFCAILLTIFSFGRVIITPFQNAIKDNKTIMEKNDATLQALIKKLDIIDFESKASIDDRANIKIDIKATKEENRSRFDRVETRLGIVEDDVIKLNERVKTLFNKGGDAR